VRHLIIKDFFAECPTKKHSAKRRALGKEPSFGSEETTDTWSSGGNINGKKHICMVAIRAWERAARCGARNWGFGSLSYFGSSVESCFR
jgi:hypothetical protein